MTTLDKRARIAGFAYLLCVLIAPFRLVYIPSILFTGDTAGWIGNIATHETLFRLGIFDDLLTAIIQLVFVLALYRLLEDVNRKQAGLMVILGGVMVPVIYFINVMNDAATLLLVRGTDFVSVFDESQRHALATLFLKMHGQVTSAAMLYWGLWLFPLALLVLRSGFLPRVLGYGLMLNGLAYVAQCVAWALLPAWEDAISSIAVPFQFVEVIFMLWLLVMGARRGFRRNTSKITAPASP